jgi:hypothetical protein
VRGRKPVAVVWRRSALPLYERDCRVLRDHHPVQTPPGPWRSAASPPLSGAADRTTRDPGCNTDPVPRPHGRRVDGLLLLLRPRSLRRPQLGDRAHRCPARPAAAAGRVGPRRPREIRASAGPTGAFRRFARHLVSGRSMEVTRSGLAEGADDYVVKAARYSGFRFRARSGRAGAIARFYRLSSNPGVSSTRSLSSQGGDLTTSPEYRPRDEAVVSLRPARR